MKLRLNKFILRPVENKVYWIAVALTFKGLFFFLQLMGHGFAIRSNGHAIFIGSYGGDTPGYLTPIEDFIKTGHYTSEYRLPGYGMVYYVLRFVFAPEWACNIIIFLQWILASISVYYMALIVKVTFAKERLFYITYFLFLISIFSIFTMHGFFQRASAPQHIFILAHIVLFDM